MIELTNTTAVITGGASGIGLGLARAALNRQMKVVLSDVSEERLSTVAGELRNDGGDVLDVVCDVRSPDAVAGLRDDAVAAYGSVNLLCNNAGVGFTKPMIDTRSADWDLVLDLNVRGVVNGIDAFLPLMLEQGTGHISATSSLSGLVADPGLSLYNASKFAVAGIMESLGLELLEQDHNVSASVLCPGPVATQLAASSAAATGIEWHDEVADYLARGLNPDAVGQMALDQIHEGRFWLITHPELTHQLIDGRIAAMREGGQLFQPDASWTNQ